MYMYIYIWYTYTHKYRSGSLRVEQHSHDYKKEGHFNGAPRRRRMTGVRLLVGSWKLPHIRGGILLLLDQDARRFSLFPDFPPYYVWDTSFRDLGTTQAKARAVLGRSTVYTQTMHMLFIRLNIYISDSMEIILLNERFWQILPCQSIRSATPVTIHIGTILRPMHI